VAEDDRADLLATDSAQCAAEEEALKDNPSSNANTGAERNDAWRATNSQIGSTEGADQSYYALCMEARGWK